MSSKRYLEELKIEAVRWLNCAEVIEKYNPHKVSIPRMDM